jgi:hypothetical protein
MSADHTDPTAWDPFDDQSPSDYDDTTDASDPHILESSVPGPTADEDAVAVLDMPGGPLELAADPAADAELQRWLDEPAPAVPTAGELAELDRQLRAHLSSE